MALGNTLFSLASSISLGFTLSACTQPLAPEIENPETTKSDTIERHTPRAQMANANNIAAPMGGYEAENGDWHEDNHEIIGAPPEIVRFPELDTNGNELTPTSEVLTWDSLPVPAERGALHLFTLPNGQTHYYQTVYLPEGGVNWVQAKTLAEQSGGYLLTVHSKAENEFAFNLITHPKYWHAFDHGNNLFVLSGPFLGGFQPAGAREPDGDWKWVTGEPMSYINWQKEDLPIGIKSRPDNQPNNSRDSQHVMAFGEVDVPASYWTDVPHGMGTFGTPLPPAHGFIIEYNERP